MLSELELKLQRRLELNGENANEVIPNMSPIKSRSCSSSPTRKIQKLANDFNPNCKSLIEVKHTFDNNDIYEGTMLHGHMHGIGTYTHSSNHNRYHGEWNNDRRHGKITI